MPTVPVKDVDCIQFFEFHQPIWAGSPSTVGLVASQLVSLDLLIKAARNSFTAQQNAKNAAKAATVNFHTAMSNLRNSGGDLIKTIRAFAQTTNNPAVYSAAQIDPPAPPAPRPAPGQPTDFSVSLTTEGALSIKWKAADAAASTGVYFNVRRKLAGQDSYEIIGNTGSKTFVDDTLPFGATSATYIVQGYRGTQAGPASDQFVVQFGVGGGNAEVARLNLAA